MPKEIFLLLGAVVGAIAAYITTKMTSRYQMDIAKLNARKDFLIQANLAYEERMRREVDLQRSKLEELHKILSLIAMENSLTVSYIQSTTDDKSLTEYRNRYLENSKKMHQAMAITDLFYPELTKLLRKIYAKTNIFWGHQEKVIQLNPQKNNSAWENNLSEVIKAAEEIAQLVGELQVQIGKIGKMLSMRQTEKANIDELIEKIDDLSRPTSGCT